MSAGHLLAYLRAHRSEWADGAIDADTAAAATAHAGLKATAGKVPLPLSFAVDEEEVRLLLDAGRDY